MNTALSTHLFLYHDLLNENIFGPIVGAGFSRIEVWAMRPHFPYFESDKIEAIRVLGAKEGVKFLTAHLPMYDRVYPPKQPRGLFSPSSEDAAVRNRWKTEAAAAARAAAGIGIKYLTLHTDLHFPGPDPRIGIAMESLRAFIAEDLPDGAVLSVENDVGGVEQIEGLLGLISGFDPARIGITLDLGHALAGGDAIGPIRATGDRLNVIHAHDNAGKSDDHLPPGHGVMPWKAVFETLDEIEFSGPLVWEIRDPTGGNDPGLVRLKEILKEIRNFEQTRP